MQPLAPLIPHWITPKRGGRLIADVLTSTSTDTGVYYDEKGKPVLASKQVRDPDFSDTHIAETRQLLASVPSA